MDLSVLNEEDRETFVPTCQPWGLQLINKTLTSLFTEEQSAFLTANCFSIPRSLLPYVSVGRGGEAES